MFKSVLFHVQSFSFFAGFFLCAGVSNGMWGLKDELPDCQLLESYLETGF